MQLLCQKLHDNKSAAARAARSDLAKQAGFTKAASKTQQNKQTQYFN